MTDIAQVSWRRKRDAGLAGQALPEPPQVVQEQPNSAGDAGASDAPAFRNPLAGLFGATATEE